MNANSARRIGELVKEAKEACVAFQEANPDWFRDDPEGATMEAVANSLGYKSFLDFVATDPSLANRDVYFEHNCLSVEHVSWELVHQIVLKRVQDS